MTWFFNSKERSFWTFQVGGWIGYGMVRTFHGMIAGWQLLEYLPVVLVTTFVGFLITIALRYFYRTVRNLSQPFIILAVFSASASLGAIFSAIETSILPFLIPNDEPYQGLQKLGNAMFESTVIFAWSAIYFGYHYYRGFQIQQERALKATAMAHQAQLKMLRYQLNPHFLFNTLNAISTLVLEKSEVDANRMLTKLSSFLRYTLVNQPTQRVTLDQELHALGLYLDIEKVRFQDRLILDFDIDERARDALIPSLILQPLIENAIKYAVAPSIDGGQIRLKATIANNRLLISIIDSGPGMEDPDHIVSKSGSGVGIVNTKERLKQIYTDDHQLQIRNLEPTGLGIFIEIPCERKKQP
ncbi:sensor histidine kinase [Kordiimonas pumila]|uniref:Sensor histidine kinase n=1 Tax=Kordiimonas pumila TaxID=2161677 RepID=A0ABV7D744_9PROT|nr:histidine kinase [Kordiimonas pumila]